jgi:hypothetical protein
MKTAAQFSHINIVISREADQAGDFHFMVMKYADRVGLLQIVKYKGANPIADACDCIRQPAARLRHAQAFAFGVVHHDIKYTI